MRLPPLAAAAVLAVVLSGCSSPDRTHGSSATAAASSSTSVAPTSFARTSVTPPSVAPTTTHGAASCPLTLTQVAAATHLPLRGPEFGPDPTDGQCGFFTTGATKTSISVEPFPNAVNPDGLATTLAHLRQLYRLGTDHDRATQKILEEPSWGRGSFVWAYLADFSAGTLEDVQVYTAHHLLTIMVATPELLGGSELRWAEALTSLLPH